MNNADISFLKGNTILVTGATGLIGKSIINRILDENEKITSSNEKISIIAIVRNIDKAKIIYGKKFDEINFIIGDIREICLNEIKPDYVVHAANTTSSKAFVNSPLEAISIALDGTRNILNQVKDLKIKRFVFLSTMEVYGTPETDRKIYENSQTNINTMNVRSCYPESKRMCENICMCYRSEYNVPVNIIRLTQTFGKGVKYDDGRVFAEFARNAIESKNIILKTKGETKRSYLFTEDAVNAILTVLSKGADGEVYNAANEKTYCSIFDMATLVAEEVANGKIKVLIEEDNPDKYGYAPTLKMNLDTSKLRSLGWEANYNLKEMYQELINDMKESRINNEN